MVRDDERHAAISVHVPPQLTDRQLGVEECLRGKRAEREDHLRLNELDLSNEVRTARDHLFRPRIPVTRRPVLEDVADEDVLSLQIDRRKNFCEQLAGGADERTARLVFSGAGRFTDTHEICVRIALARNSIGRRRIQRTSCAARDVRGEQVDCGK